MCRPRHTRSAGSGPPGMTARRGVPAATHQSSVARSSPARSHSKSTRDGDRARARPWPGRTRPRSRTGPRGTPRASRRPAVWSIKNALPPMLAIPASNVRRVRKDCFSKNITICLPASAVRKFAGRALSSPARWKMVSTSIGLRSRIEIRSRPGNVELLEGGFKAWKAAGLPIEGATEAQPIPGEPEAGIPLL